MRYFRPRVAYTAFTNIFKIPSNALTVFKQAICAAIVSVLGIHPVSAQNLHLNDPSVSTILPPLTANAQQLVTGNNKGDRNAYWNCRTTNELASTENIHLRLWKNGEGFSGTSDISWKILENNTLTITYSAGTTEISAITFASLNHENDSFRAADGASNTVDCEWVGPLRNSLAIDLYSDGGLRDKVYDDFTTQDNTLWTCSDLQDPVYSTFDLQLLRNSDAILNTEYGRWFVDDRYNIIVAINNDIKVLQKLDINIDKNSFSTSLKGVNLNCSLQND
jgi:hypothetical protein